MDRIELTTKDAKFLLAWRDEHKELVRSFPAPLKSCEIVFIEAKKMIKGFRCGNEIKLYVNVDGKSIGHLELEIRNDGLLALKKNKCKVDNEDRQTIITMYSTTMAFIAHCTTGNKELTDKEPNYTTKHEKAPHRASQKPPAKIKRIVYLMHDENGQESFRMKASHKSPKGEFSVRGHYRHYKSGKVVWIEQFSKGVGKKLKKTYKVRKESDSR